jgi:deoxyribodipyrimidine photolyase
VGVPELAGVAGKAVHQPWSLSESLDYPQRIATIR